MVTPNAIHQDMAVLRCVTQCFQRLQGLCSTFRICLRYCCEPLTPSAGSSLFSTDPVYIIRYTRPTGLGTTHEIKIAEIEGYDKSGAKMSISPSSPATDPAGYVSFLGFVHGPAQSVDGSMNTYYQSAGWMDEGEDKWVEWMVDDGVMDQIKLHTRSTDSWLLVGGFMTIKVRNGGVDRLIKTYNFEAAKTSTTISVPGASGLCAFGCASVICP